MSYRRIVSRGLRYTRFVLPGLVISLYAVGCNIGGSGGSGGTSGSSGPPEITTACCSSGTPSGYYKIGDSWSSTSCGNPSSIVYNVCTYQRYDNKSIGATMNICAGQSLASGWLQIDTDWNPTTCGHPSSIIQNIWTVRRNS